MYKRQAEVAELRKYHDEQREAFRAKPDSALALVKSAAPSVAQGLNACEFAAWTMTASLLLNLDETQTQH